MTLKANLGSVERGQNVKRLELLTLLAMVLMSGSTDFRLIVFMQLL
jgi:hypothetical protein